MDTFPGALWAQWTQVYGFGSAVVYGQNCHKNNPNKLYDLYNYTQGAGSAKFWIKREVF